MRRVTGSTAPPQAGRTSSAEQTRAKLIEHGRAAFAAKGHDNVSLQRDVLKPAGVSNGSFYHQFRDKTDLLVAVLEDGRERGHNVVESAVDESADTPPVERLRKRLLVWFELLEYGEDMYRIQSGELDNEDERVRSLLADFRHGTFAPLTQKLAAAMASRSDHFDAERATLFVRELFKATALDYLDMPQDQRTAKRAAIAADLAAFIIGGLTGMAGIPNPSGVATQ